MKRAMFLVLAGWLLAGDGAQAEITIECGGHIRAINDYMQWKLKIDGTDAELGGQHYSVEETKRFYILTRPGSEIRIDKVSINYVEWGPKGKKVPPVEWTRNVFGEGCVFSR